MQKWIVSPIIAAMLSQSLVANDHHVAPLGAPGHKSAAQQFCETIYREWFRLHSAAAHQGRTIQAEIVFAPQRGTLTLSRGGQKPEKTIQLPSGLKWYAFHVSVDGVRELSFPVVLERPHHHDPRTLQDDEEIVIVGDAAKTQTYFRIGSRLSGVTAGGSGPSRGISKRNHYRVPMQARQEHRFAGDVSMLASDKLQSRPSEILQSGEVSVQVVRQSIGD